MARLALGVVVHTYIPGLKRLRLEDFKFKTKLSNTVRACLKNKQTLMKTNKQKNPKRKQDLI
jgi:hypothetical protein